MYLFIFYFQCFDTVIDKKVEVLENEKLKWEHESTRRVFRVLTSVSITYGNRSTNVFYFFYKITRKKLEL